MLGSDPLGSVPLGSIEGEGTPELRITQVGVLAAVEGNDLRTTQLAVLTAINFPTEQLRATQVGIMAAVTSDMKIRVTQVRVLAAVRGRIANSRLRAWTFSLDGHDFYVLRLGDTVTLVYDVYSEQWMDWDSFGEDFWNVNVGMNWVGAAALADTYGSNIVVGDDSRGVLWFLDPEQPYDVHPDTLSPVQEQYFERIAMGQVPVRGREVLPCYVCWITADMGDPAYIGAGVTLSISDDAGETFDDMGTVTVTLGEYQPELSWYSLGQIGAPGRLFKIVDDGAIARIDGLEMNDPDDAG